jgi:hypothetical protein
MPGLFHVCVASRNNKIDAQTMLTLQACGYFMGKNSAVWHIVSTNWIAYARKKAVQLAYQTEGQETLNEPEHLRGLIIDDDLLIMTGAKELADIFMDTDKKGINITANYKSGSGANLVFDEGGRRYTDAKLRELAATTDYVPLVGDIGTMGFYYGELPKTYTWHQDSEVDESTNFFRDNKHLKTHLAAKIKLSHRIDWMRSTFQNYDSTD